MNKPDATIHDLSDFVFERLRKSPKPYYQPDCKTLEALFNCLYFASMNCEEGELVQVRVAYFNPEEPEGLERRKEDRWNFAGFNPPRPFDLRTVVKLSKSVDPWSGSLSVYPDENGQLVIHGLIDQAIHAESFLHRETNAKPEQAGLFQVAVTGIGCLSVTMDYDLIATFKQNELVTHFLDAIRFGPLGLRIKENAEVYRQAIRRLLRANGAEQLSSHFYTFVENMLRDTISRLLIHIRNYRHGGALLISDVTDGLELNYQLRYNRLRTAMERLAWTTIIYNQTFGEVEDVSDGVIPSPLFVEYRAVVEKKKTAENELKGAIRFTASHSRVDGLILLNSRMEEISYGAIVQTIDLPSEIWQASDNTATVLQKKNAEHYGTRHKSTISFCWKNPGSIGFVISQDGDLRAFLRVQEKLIMWENIKIQRYVKAESLKRRSKR